MTRYKPKKDSLVEFNRKYANNDEACEEYFFQIRYPDGYVCEKCGCTHYKKITGRGYCYSCSSCGHQQYLLAGTIFQDNKLPLYKLLLGLFLFFTANKGISAMEMRSHLDVNYKTALLLCRKCRILMSQSTADKVLDAMFYESDVTYIGGPSKEPGHRGMATEKQPYLIVLSTGQDNRYPEYVKAKPVAVDNSTNVNEMFESCVKMSPDRVLNTDGKTTYNILKDRMTVVNQKVDYTDKHHRLKWLNTIIGNIQTQIIGIYHGVSKRDLPLFVNEQVYRYNHRNTGRNMLNKINKYLRLSSPMPRKAIIQSLDQAMASFTA